MSDERPRADGVGAIDSEMHTRARALSHKIQQLIAEQSPLPEHSTVMNALLMLLGYGISMDDDPDNALQCAIQVLVANHGGDAEVIQVRIVERLLAPSRDAN